MLKYILLIIILISACQSTTEKIRLNLNERQVQQLSHFLKTYQIDAIPFQEKKEWGLQVPSSQLSLTWAFLQKNALTQLKAKVINASPQNAQWWMNQKDKSMMAKQKQLNEIEDLLLMLPKLNAFYVDVIENEHLFVYLKVFHDQNINVSEKNTMINQEALVKQTLLKILPKTQIEVMIDEISFNENDPSKTVVLNENTNLLQVHLIQWLTLIFSLMALLISGMGIYQWYRQKKSLIS